MNSDTDKLTATHADLLAVCGDEVYNCCNYKRETKDKIDSCLLKYYIRDHNLIVSSFDKDYENATHRALQCILHGWYVASLKAFRYSVCVCHMHFILGDLFACMCHMHFIILHLAWFVCMCVSYALHIHFILSCLFALVCHMHFIYTLY